MVVVCAGFASKPQGLRTRAQAGLEQKGELLRTSNDGSSNAVSADSSCT